MENTNILIEPNSISDTYYLLGRCIYWSRNAIECGHSLIEQATKVSMDLSKLIQTMQNEPPGMWMQREALEEQLEVESFLSDNPDLGVNEQFAKFIIKNRQYERIRYEEERLIDIFIFLVDRVIFSLKTLEEIDEEFCKIKESIDSSAGKGNIRKLRNHRMHLDDYLKIDGSGRKRKLDFWWHKTPNGITDVLSSNWQGNDFIIGGLLPVVKVTRTIEDYFDRVERLCLEHMYNL